MSTILPGFSDHQNWREFYHAAIIESDSSRVPQRISQAEIALVQRARELFQDVADNSEEKRSLNDAIYALRVFRMAIERAARSVCR